jgi:hypothetical protein
MITLATLQVALFDTVGVWAKKKTSQTASGTERGRNRKKNNHCLLSTLVYNVIQKNVNVFIDILFRIYWMLKKKQSLTKDRKMMMR